MISKPLYEIYCSLMRTWESTIIFVDLELLNLDLDAARGVVGKKGGYHQGGRFFNNMTYIQRDNFGSEGDLPGRFTGGITGRNPYTPESQSKLAILKVNNSLIYNIKVIWQQSITESLFFSL